MKLFCGKEIESKDTQRNNDKICMRQTKTVDCLSLCLKLEDYLKEVSRKSQPISYLHQNRKLPNAERLQRPIHGHLVNGQTLQESGAVSGCHVIAHMDSKRTQKTQAARKTQVKSLVYLHQIHLISALPSKDLYGCPVGGS